jgi:hypothetical protein
MYDYICIEIPDINKPKLVSRWQLIILLIKLILRKKKKQ